MKDFWKDFWAVVFFFSIIALVLISFASAINGDFAKAAYFIGMACLMHMMGRW